MPVQSHSTLDAAVALTSETRKAALVAFLAGAALVFAAGFSHSATMHNAGHDTRHALSFPCH